MLNQIPGEISFQCSALMQASWGSGLSFSKFLCENITWKHPSIFPLVLCILHSRSYQKIRVEVRIFCVTLTAVFFLAQDKMHLHRLSFGANVGLIGQCCPFWREGHCGQDFCLCNDFDMSKLQLYQFWQDWRWLEVEHDNCKEKAWNPTRYCRATSSCIGTGRDGDADMLPASMWDSSGRRADMSTAAPALRDACVRMKEKINILARVCFPGLEISHSGFNPFGVVIRFV